MMVICFILLVALVLCLSMFLLTTNLQSINRIVLYTPKEIFETSIPLTEIGETFEPKFDNRDLDLKLTEYYDARLTKYCKSYYFELYFYNAEDMSICMEYDCNCVEVTVYATVVFDYKYSRTIFYEIKEGVYGK